MAEGGFSPENFSKPKTDFSVTEFDTCTRTTDDLVLVSERGKKNPFLKTLTGELPLARLPLYLPPDILVTNGMEKMRDFAAQNDNEQHSGIYQSPLGDFYFLKNPSVGGFNPIDDYYFSGPVPEIPGHALTIDIHSHPPGYKFRTAGAKPEVDIKNEREAGSHLPSTGDYGDLVLTGKNPYTNSVRAKITVGQGLVTAACRTKETEPKQEIIRERKWVWVDVMNRFIAIQEEVKSAHPDYDAISKNLLTVGKACQEHNLGWYLMRLRKSGLNNGRWVRFNPWPDNLSEAISTLLAK